MEVGMDSLDGKVALITGAARGQGRSHAIQLARAGVDLILVDICAAPSDDVEYPPATEAELEDVVSEVQRLGRRATGHVIDIRDFEILDRAVRDSAAELGGLDIVLANAGYVSWSRFWEMTPAHWQNLIDVTLTGTFNTLKAAAPIMIEQGRGGSIIITNSPAGLKAMPGQMHYTTAKHGLVGLTKAAAIELGPYGIQVNSLHPHVVETHMGQRTKRMAELIEANPSYLNSFGRVLYEPHFLSCEDVSQTVLYMLSPGARHMTGAQLSLDAGSTIV
jgi:SDR family mycofactocin-dependent oxidoreductase